MSSLPTTVRRFGRSLVFAAAVGGSSLTARAEPTEPVPSPEAAPAPPPESLLRRRPRGRSRAARRGRGSTRSEASLLTSVAAPSRGGGQCRALGHHVLVPQDQRGGGAAQASMLLFSYKVTPELAPLLRLGFVHDAPPSGDAAGAFLNPVLGVTYAAALAPGLKLAAFLGVTLPVGSGGGNTPDKAVRGALGAGILARSAMETRCSRSTIWQSFRASTWLT